MDQGSGLDALEKTRESERTFAPFLSTESFQFRRSRVSSEIRHDP